MDDVVVFNNANTEQGRDKTLQQYNHLSSVEVLVHGNGYSEQGTILTIYTQLFYIWKYQTMMLWEIHQYSALFDYREWPVENVGDGTGEYIWPRSKSPMENTTDLTVKSSQLNVPSTQLTWFSSEPNTITIRMTSTPPQSNEIIFNTITKTTSPDEITNGTTNETLNVVAAVDFAFSIGRKADYTAIVVIGVDGKRIIMSSTSTDSGRTRRLNTLSELSSYMKNGALERSERKSTLPKSHSLETSRKLHP